MPDGSGSLHQVKATAQWWAAVLPNSEAQAGGAGAKFAEAEAFHLVDTFTEIRRAAVRSAAATCSRDRAPVAAGAPWIVVVPI